MSGEITVSLSSRNTLPWRIGHATPHRNISTGPVEQCLMQELGWIYPETMLCYHTSIDLVFLPRQRTRKSIGSRHARNKKGIFNADCLVPWNTFFFFFPRYHFVSSSPSPSLPPSMTSEHNGPPFHFS